MTTLEGKVAVVTGGYRGLGLGMSRALRDAGAEVSMWARSAEAMQEVAEELDAQAVECDIRSRDDVDRALRATLHRYGHVDVVVANAGRPSAFKTFTEIDEESWSDILATNLDGAFRVSQAAARQMVEQGSGGKIIFVTSIRAGRGAPHAIAYAASKAGMEGLVRSMAVGLAEHGVQVNAIRPGWMETDMTAALRADPQRSAALMRQVPVGRWGSPEDLAGIVVYLASAASDFHTGDVITVDGGISAGDPADPTAMSDDE